MATFPSRLLGLVFIIALTGCSTISSRIEKNRAAFDRLAPQQQALVSNGEIREGMNRTAVYIAWGRPDNMVRGSRDRHFYETWVYNAYYYQDFPSFYYLPVRVGGLVYYDSIFQPGVVAVPYAFKRATFEGNRVVAWSIGTE